MLSNPPTRSDAGPCPAGTALSPFPLLRRLRWIRHCRDLPDLIHRCCDVSARSTISLAGSLSSWLDSSLSWPSRPDPLLPLLLYAGVATLTSADARVAAGLLGEAPRRPYKRSKNVHVVAARVASPTIDARTSTAPPEERGNAPPRLRLPRHPGTIIYTMCTPVSTLAATLTPSRRCDCEGFQLVGSYLRFLLQSHRVRWPRATVGGC